MSTNTTNQNVLPPKIPSSKPPSLPDRNTGSGSSRGTMNGKQAPSTPPPPIPARNPSTTDVNSSMGNLNLNGGQNTPPLPTTAPPSLKSRPVPNPNLNLNPSNLHSNNNLGNQSPSHSSTSPQPHSPLNHSPLNHSPLNHSPLNHSPLSHSPSTHSPTNSGRPLPQPKEQTNTSTNSFKQVLNNHPMSSQNHHNSQYNTSPIPHNHTSANNSTNNHSMQNLKPAPPRKLPPQPLPHIPNRNTISVTTHPLQPNTDNNSEQIDDLPQPLLPNPSRNTMRPITPTRQNSELNSSVTQKSTSSSDDIEINFANNSLTQSNASLNSSYPNLDHLNQFTSMRDLKVKEILITERTYVDNMKILVEVFIEPLKAGEGGISKDYATIICSNLADILMVNVELLKGLESKLADWSETQTIGAVFKDLTPFLKMYTNYTVGFDNVLSIVSECEKNSSFVTFISKCTEDTRTKKLDLRSYLIQPVQRITRYNMLLEEVIKHTDDTHPDYLELKKALEEMKKVTLEANEAIKKSENRAKVFEIQKMFVKDPEIVAAHREYVFDGILTKVCRKACKKRHVFLFSDIIVYGSSIPPKLMLHEKFELEHCRIEDIPDGSSSITNNGQPVLNAFQINSNKKSFVVFADSNELKMKWMLHLTQTIGLQQEKRKTIKTEKITRAEAPLWVPDDTTPNCTQCNDAFSFINRRHHCRRCGLLVCGDCSSNKYKLPISDFKPVRVCNKCYDELISGSTTVAQMDE
ncbi:pleckstrin (PH) domain-containing protein [Tieghemostelium lacteum]|uniref:Pleckstrin (PH) domain-containing protein n=1 Tax=Tieghemostelium lacteum TaxID=361077 RepID=A0A151Z5L8_TIELA|nr:pleckstrin (PH) domain-containing protein [Tieghemostelium lacteum]|eukprot:KYQ89256.1 pleckstrin (PH) domain-containing protein [Tieghemostelium lacteum]